MELWVQRSPSPVSMKTPFFRLCSFLLFDIMKMLQMMLKVIFNFYAYVFYKNEWIFKEKTKYFYVRLKNSPSKTVAWKARALKICVKQPNETNETMAFYADVPSTHTVFPNHKYSRKRVSFISLAICLSKCDTMKRIRCMFNTVLCMLVCCCCCCFFFFNCGF